VRSAQPGSSSLQQPEYWWYRARADLLQAALGPHVGQPSRVLDVGSADGPSVGWLQGDFERWSLDVDPRGLAPGRGVCGSATALPFKDAVFDVVSAFDVVEHCADEGAALRELARVLTPGGRLLVSVPAYQWAWTDHDVQAGHHRRYTRARLGRAVERSGLVVQRASYGFAGVFPFFVAERVARRVGERRRGPRSHEDGLPGVGVRVERLLVALSRVEAGLLVRTTLPFGSSVFLAAVKLPAQ
jgi:SAM-dependent methyltransferase